MSDYFHYSIGMILQHEIESQLRWWIPNKLILDAHKLANEENQ